MIDKGFVELLYHLTDGNLDLCDVKLGDNTIYKTSYNNEWNQNEQLFLCSNKDIYVFLMPMTQAYFYINQYTGVFKEFENLLKKYVTILEKINNKKIIEQLKLFFKVRYDTSTGLYELSLSFNSSIFNQYKMTYSSALSTWEAAILSVMRLNPNTILSGEMSQSDFDLIANLTDYDNIIYANHEVSKNQFFTIKNDFYLKNSLFEAIDSHFNVIDGNTDTILNPLFVDDMDKVNNLIDIVKMIKI